MDEPRADEDQDGGGLLVTRPWPELRIARKALFPEAVTELRDLLTTSGFFQAFADLVVQLAQDPELIAFHADAEVDAEPVDPEALRAAGVKATRDLCARYLRIANNETFRTHFTRDALAHAAAWAMSDLTRAVPRARLLAMDEGAFAEAYQRSYERRDYLAQALEGLLPTYIEMAASVFLESIENTPAFAEKLTAAAQQILTTQPAPVIFQHSTFR